MDGNLIVVKATFDPEARMWFVEDSDLEGVNAEAPTLEALLEKLPNVVADLLEANGAEAGHHDIPIELIAHARTRTRIGEAA